MDKITLGDQSNWNEDLRYQYDLKPTDYVLDIGSYRMEFADKIRSLFRCKVECFDALDNRAAWIYDGKLAVGGNYLYTSMYSEVLNKECDCVDIANYLQREVALCKINIEGGEYELLQYIISKDLMKNIKNLQVQFHYIDGKDCVKMYEVIKDFLSLTHRIKWRFPFVWENWERI